MPLTGPLAWHERGKIDPIDKEGFRPQQINEGGARQTDVLLRLLRLVAKKLENVVSWLVGVIV